VICVAEFTANAAAGVEVNVTFLAPVNPVPVLTTCCPPDSGPTFGDTPVIVGATTPAATIRATRPTPRSTPPAGALSCWDS
jgi:hypothetical protein